MQLRAAKNVKKAYAPNASNRTVQQSRLYAQVAMPHFNHSTPIDSSAAHSVHPRLNREKGPSLTSFLVRSGVTKFRPGSMVAKWTIKLFAARVPWHIRTKESQFSILLEGARALKLA